MRQPALPNWAWCMNFRCNGDRPAIHRLKQKGRRIAFLRLPGDTAPRSRRAQSSTVRGWVNCETKKEDPKKGRKNIRCNVVICERSQHLLREPQTSSDDGVYTIQYSSSAGQQGDIHVCNGNSLHLSRGYNCVHTVHTIYYVSTNIKPVLEQSHRTGCFSAELLLLGRKKKNILAS